MNFYRALKHLYPDLELDIDFVLKDDGAGPYILKWNPKTPLPTDAALLEAWNEIKDIPIAQPKTELEILKETVDQLVLDNLMRGF